MQDPAKFGNVDWPVSYGGRQRFAQLLAQLPEQVRRELGDSAAWAHLFREPLVRFLAARFISRLEQFLNDLDGANPQETAPFPNLEAFLSAADALTLMLPAIRALPCDEAIVRDRLNEFLKALDSALGHHCRLRVYRIDAAAGCYRGLASRGMKLRDYANHFDVAPGARGVPFEKTERLPRSAAKYGRMEGTACQRLTTDAIASLDTNDRDWYARVIGFGKVVAASYTWEFTPDGVEELSYADDRAKPERYVAAISIDGGAVRSPNEKDAGIENRSVHLLSIDWLDDLLRSPIGDAFAGGISGLVGTLAERAGKSAPARNVAMVNDGLALLTPRLKAIPAGVPNEHSWIFAEGDEACENVYKLYDKFRNSDVWLGILGASGVGKEVIARALHNNGHRRGGQFIKVNVPGWTSELVSIVGGGIAAGTFTGQGDSAQSVFEAAHGGTCFWDEVFLADAVTLGKLLSPLSDLKERREATRTGLGDVQNRAYPADIRSISAGDPSKQEPFFDGHMERRLFGAKMPLPSWADLSIDSRTVLVRWMMLHALREHNLKDGRMSAALFRYLVYGEPETLLETNMGGLSNIWQTLGELQTNGVFNLRCLREQFRPAEQAIAASLMDAGHDADYPESLRLGGGECEKRLSAFERVALRIARCNAGGSAQDACVSEEEGRAAIEELLGFQEKPLWHDQLCEALYLLFAASSLHLTTMHPSKRDAETAARSEKKDLLATAPRPLLRHFQNRSAFEEPFKSALGRPLGSLTKRTANEPKTALRFQEFIEQPDVVARLLQSVERIACAYPPFLHHVPYWAHWADRHVGQSGNISGESVFQERDQDTLPTSGEEDYEN